MYSYLLLYIKELDIRVIILLFSIYIIHMTGRKKNIIKTEFTEITDKLKVRLNVKSAITIEG